MLLLLDRTWDDRPAGVEVRVRLARTEEAVTIDVDAPFMGDPAPPGPPGSTPGLWDYEVVEVFFLGEDERYLEVELSPHGHHLVLELSGVRRVVREGLPIDYRSSIRGRRWRGTARVAATLLPPGWDRVNAFAIHGRGAARRHLAHLPVGGEAPDFHRLEVFTPISLALARAGEGDA